MQVAPQQLALAELAQSEQLAAASFTRNAALVANNITTLRKAASDLATAPSITVAGIDDLHHTLLPDEQHPGQRLVQNWIGGNDWHPLDAQFVPPPPEHVSALMDDLVQYANSRSAWCCSPDPMPIWTVSPPTVTMGQRPRLMPGPVWKRGLWTFLGAAELAVDQVVRFASEVSELRARWREQIAIQRSTQGVRTVPRADSAVARLIELLPETPLVTARTVQRMLAVSPPAARTALEELADVKIVTRKNVARGTTGYFAWDVFDLLTIAERRLASTRWDTRQSAPSRTVPALPHTVIR